MSRNLSRGAPLASAKRVLEQSPLGQLRKARAAKGAATRAKYARAGLEQSPEDAETRWMLMRQLYISHLELGAWPLAHAVAAEMTGTLSELEDVARFDVARVHLAKHEWALAKAEFERGEQVAPASRQWDHRFARARVEAIVGQPERAISLLDEARQSVVRFPKDAVVRAALLVWRAQAGARARRDALGRAYEQLASAETLPALGDFFAARLLALLERAEARSVFEGFLDAVEALPTVARLGFEPETHCARECLGKPILLT